MESIADAPFIALDTETSGLDPHTEKLLLIQFGTAEKQALVDAEAVDAHLVKRIFEDDRIVVMHNASFDIKMLMGAYGPELELEKARIADTLSAERLIRNGRKSSVVMPGYALKTLAERYAGMELDKSIRQGFYGIQSVQELSDAELHYAERDVEATWKVFAEQLPMLERDGLMRVAAIEGAASVPFAHMEYYGAPIDKDAWQRLVDEAKTNSAEARKSLDREFWTVADRDLFGGTTLNYSDDAEVLDALRKLGVDARSTKKEALLATGHSAARAVAEYREHQKIVSSYGETFLQHVHKTTGRIHPRFRPMGATTGRASCSEPNLQNIPARSAFRACFRVPEGRKLITADYQGAELRIIAEASKDPVFIRTMAKGQDLHAVVASRLFGKLVTKEEHPELRARAKAISFGLAYGMGANALAEQLNVDPPEAERLLNQYFQSFPKIRDFFNRSAHDALRRGYTRSMSGRCFWFQDMRQDGKDEGTMVRVAKNMPIQGTNADMTKVAMARITRSIRERGYDAFLVNMVHDELVVESSEGDAEAVKEMVESEMISAAAEFIKRVPVEVDATVSSTWSK